MTSGPAAPVTAPAEINETVDDAVPSPDNPWVVLVWNDPINLMSYVTFVLQKLFGYPLEVAEKLMLQVHYDGRAVVSSGTREKAELDVFRLHEHGLWPACERDFSLWFVPRIGANTALASARRDEPGPDDTLPQVAAQLHRQLSSAQLRKALAFGDRSAAAALWLLRLSSRQFRRVVR